MSDLDHRSPELDRAFAALTDDLASHPGRPGATAAIATVRRRRRTAVASVAVASAVAAAAAVLPSLLPSDGRDAGDRRDSADVAVAATPQELTPALLTEATQGWIGPWRAARPDDFDALDSTGTNTCMDSGTEIADPDRFGDRIFVSSGQVALAFFGEYDPAGTQRGVKAFERFTGGLRGGCAPGLTESVVGSTLVAHATVAGGGGVDPHDLWVAGAGDRFAALVVFRPPSGAPEDITTDVAEALASALGAEKSFTGSELLMPDISSEEEPSVAEVPPSSSFPALELGDVEDAAAGWDAGRSTGDGSMVSTSCMTSDWPAASSWGQSATLGDRGLLGYAGSTDPGGDVAALLDALRGCEAATWEVHEQGSTAWATTGSEALFVVQREETVAWLAFRDVSAPTTGTARGVLALLEDNLAGAIVTEPDAG